MVNIFDWHEKKSPEELAKELGISDLSVVENAGKETAEILVEENDGKDRNSPINPFLWLTVAEMNDKRKWIRAQNRNQLEEWMRVMFEWVGKILKIYESKTLYRVTTITVWFSNGSIKEFNDHDDNIEIIFFYSKDLDSIIMLWENILNNDNNWRSNYKIYDLERGMRLRKHNNWERYGNWRILDVDIENHKVKVINSWEIKEFCLLSFFTTFDVYKKDFEPVKIRKLWYEWSWTSDYSLIDLKTNMYMTKDGHLYKIKEIDGGNIHIRSCDNVESFEWDTSTYIDTFASIKEKHQILKEKPIS